MSPGDSLGSVQIGAQQIYDLALATSVKVDVLLTQHSDLAKDSADHEVRLRQVEDARPGPRIQNLEERMRQVESRQWPLPTLAVLVAIASLALSMLVALGMTGR